MLNNQLLANVLILSAIILLISLALSVFYTTAKFFNLAQAAILSSAPYFSYLILVWLKLPLYIAILFSLICTTAMAIFCELSIYRYMRRKNLSPFSLLIASIGLYTIIQNTISLFFGDESRSIRTEGVKVGRQIGEAYVTDIQIITIAVSAIVFMGVLLLIYRTSLGKQIRAVSSNSELCIIYGINSDRIILWSTIISTTLVTITGILIALDVDMTPTFGFNYFLYGVVAMIIGGIGSYRGLVFGSLSLSTAQHLAAYYIDTKWMTAVAYIILILFLIWKPLGFGRQSLKKVEV